MKFLYLLLFCSFLAADGIVSGQECLHYHTNCQDMADWTNKERLIKDMGWDEHFSFTDIIKVYPKSGDGHHHEDYEIEMGTRLGIVERNKPTLKQQRYMIEYQDLYTKLDDGDFQSSWVRAGFILDRCCCKPATSIYRWRWKMETDTIEAYRKLKEDFDNYFVGEDDVKCAEVSYKSGAKCFSLSPACQNLNNIDNLQNIVKKMEWNEHFDFYKLIKAIYTVQYPPIFEQYELPNYLATKTGVEGRNKLTSSGERYAAVFQDDQKKLNPDDFQTSSTRTAFLLDRCCCQVATTVYTYRRKIADEAEAIYQEMGAEFNKYIDSEDDTNCAIRRLNEVQNGSSLIPSSNSLMGISLLLVFLVKSMLSH